MEIKNIEEMKGGWFIGNFNPSVFNTKQFEVGYKVHPKGKARDKHFHKVATEINYLIRGSMKICGKTVVKGQVFTIHPGEIADADFIEECEWIVVKVPCVPEDKYYCE